MTREALEREVSEAVARIAPLLASRQMAIWVGSGISSLAIDHNREQCYPDWKGLIDLLCEDCGIPLQGTHSGQENCDIADKCKSRNSRAYYDTLGRIFGRQPASIPRSVSHLLRLGAPTLITTNYDHVLECAARDCHRPIHWQAYDELETGFHVATPCLAYLHGRGPDVENGAASKLVLATSEFREAYKADHESMELGNAYRFLLSVIPDVNVLFVGYSLDEPLVGTTLGKISALRDRNRKPAEWVMLAGRSPEDSRNGSRDEPSLRWQDEAKQIQRAEELDIEVVTYTKVDGNHSQLERILERLSEMTPPAGRDHPRLAVVGTTGADVYDS